MNVALLQVGLDASSPSRNLQRILHMIDRAAAALPAPDLLVLPGGCDTGGAKPAKGRPIAMIQNVREAIAHKAREWGVYIASGLHVRDGGGFRHAAVLFDPDADVAAIDDGIDAADRASDGAPARWCSTVGDVGLCAVRGVVRFDSALNVPARGLLQVAPLTPDADAVPGKTGAHWAIVRAAKSRGRSRTKNEPSPTRLVDPRGKVVRAAERWVAEVVAGEVDIRPATPEERASASADMMA